VIGVVGLLVVGLVATMVWALSAALATPVPPTPTITSGPTGATTSTTATFTYTDTKAGVSFKCSLDGAVFTGCASSGVTYTHLADGSHTFKVEAVSGASTSGAASRSWSVDTTAPRLTVTFPVDGGAYNASGWNGCVPAGVCGTASDPSGVASVAAAVVQQSSGKYWTGSAFSSSTRVFHAATGTTAWHYGLVRPPDGTYTVYAEATDTLGNTTPTNHLVAATFMIDTVAPPAPLIVDGPSNPSKDKNPEFTLADVEYGVSFVCTLDSGPPMNCTGETDHDGDFWVQGEIQYTNLAAGPHCFSAVAIDRAGNHSTPTQFCWTIGGTGLPFTISGNLAQVLYPGTSGSLDLSITNPNSSPITIASGGITIVISSTQAGCSAATNFAVTQGLTASITIPATSTKSLSALGIPTANWPVISMKETHTNQNACQAASLTLTYSGSATG